MQKGRGGLQRSGTLGISQLLSASCFLHLAFGLLHSASFAFSLDVELHHILGPFHDEAEPRRGVLAHRLVEHPR